MASKWNCKGREKYHGSDHFRDVVTQKSPIWRPGKRGSSGVGGSFLHEKKWHGARPKVTVRGEEQLQPHEKDRQKVQTNRKAKRPLARGGTLTCNPAHQFKFGEKGTGTRQFQNPGKWAVVGHRYRKECKRGGGGVFITARGERVSGKMEGARGNAQRV